MNINPAILQALQKNHNMITTSQVLALGFSKQTLQKYIRMGLLERIRHGLYILPEAIHDDMYTMMLRSDRIIFSHESALFLNGCATRTPFVYSITMPSDHVVPRSIKDECVCFYVKPAWHQLGLIMRPTPFGHTVRCYDLERTICDLLRTRKRCDEETVIAALKGYAANKSKNLHRLSAYAETFKVASDLSKYLEVLL